jgi:hypothetical protein
MTKRKRTKGPTMISKTLHRKLINEQHESRKKSRMKSGSLEGYAVPAPRVASVMFLLNDMNIM